MDEKDAEKGSVAQVNRIFLATVAAAMVASFLIGALQPIFGGDELAALVVSQAVYFLPTALYLWRNGFRLREALRLRPIRPGTVALLVAFLYLLMPAITYVNAISLKFTTNTIDETVTTIAAEYPFWVALLAIAIVPAILEESVYRGVFFNEYRKVDPRKAVVLSGLLFGLAHMNFNQFIYAFLLGMVFSLVVEVTDSLLGSMALHFVMNGTSVAVAYLQEAMPGSAGAALGEAAGMASVDAYLMTGLPSALVGAFLSFWLLRWIARREGRSEVLAGMFRRRAGSEAGTRLVTPALWVGMAFCVGIMLLVEVA